MSDSNSDTPSNQITLRGAGLDTFWNILDDHSPRAIRIEGEDYFSLVDLMIIFGADNRESKTRDKPFNARRYWNQRKKTLLEDDQELYDSIVQLKARGADSKLYSTDFAPRWVCLYIVLGMNTATAKQFRKHAAKALDTMSKAAIRYRAINVSQGMEWAADTTHEDLLAARLEPPNESDRPWQDIGYSK